MAVLLYLWLSLLSLATAADNNSFISPKYQSASSSRFGGVSKLDLGSSQLIAFQSTWTEYKIEFWQQNLTAGSARLSDTLVYEQNSGEDKPQSFYWTVQTYELQLVDSPVFFFWLKDKSSSDSITSPYFNITIPASSSSSANGATSTSLSTLATSITTTAAASDTTSSSTVSQTAVATTTTSSLSSGSSNGLSTGATAGIAVGVSVVGFSALACLGLFFWRRRKNMAEVADQRQNALNTQEYNSKSQYSPSYAQASPQELSTEVPDRRPAELS